MPESKDYVIVIETPQNELSSIIVPASSVINSIEVLNSTDVEYNDIISVNPLNNQQ